jgi:hypothetical protein
MTFQAIRLHSEMDSKRMVICLQVSNCIFKYRNIVTKITKTKIALMANPSSQFLFAIMSMIKNQLTCVFLTNRTCARFITRIWFFGMRAVTWIASPLSVVVPSNSHVSTVGAISFSSLFVNIRKSMNPFAHIKTTFLKKVLPARQAVLFSRQNQFSPLGSALKENSANWLFCLEIG